jgi:hypothetical protein
LLKQRKIEFGHVDRILCSDGRIMKKQEEGLRCEGSFEDNVGAVE